MVIEVWTEKYRPKTISEIKGQQEITSRLDAFVKTKNFPHLLFAGPAGTGKTTAALAISRQLYGDNWKDHILELNASDERGIDVVRSTIKEFARTLAFNTGFKIIFLDESDALTSDAQQALRRTMEKYTKTTRFILSANYSSKLIEPLQSRCVIFRFRPLSNEKIKERLKLIIEQEKLQADEKSLDAVIYVAQGDLRKAINILQASASLGEKITDEIVYNVSSRARPEEITNMLNSALKGEFLDARNQLDTLIFEHGMSGEDVLLQLYRELINLDETAIDNKSKIELIDAIGEANFRIVEGANERIQLEALLAKFLKYKK